MLNPSKNSYFRFKSIRDPLYGFIDISKIETRLIDTVVFRRLQNIKQLSHAYVVYPSAIHTRFEHSLGALHIANRLISELGFEDKEKEIIRIGMLLHDIGHGPFSHLFEHMLGKINDRKNIHEEISRGYIQHDPEIKTILGDKIEPVIKLLKHEQVEDWDQSTSSLASDIISSGLDADKLDYLRRDSYHIGVAYGQFDLERIIHMIRSTPNVEKHICVDDKGKDAIENYRLGRYLMHAQVYAHHSRIVADQMFLKALDLAVHEEDIIDPNKLVISPSSSNDEFFKFYNTLDDRSIYDLIINSKPTSKSAKILQNIKKRKLLKRVFESQPDKDISDAVVRQHVMKLTRNDLERISGEIATDVGLEKHDVIVYVATIPINLYDGEILVLSKGIAKTLDELSPIKASESTINKFYIFGPDDSNLKAKIKESASERLKMPT